VAVNLAALLICVRTVIRVDYSNVLEAGLGALSAAAACGFGFLLVLRFYLIWLDLTGRGETNH
jgi:hypothetical protein